MAGGKSPDQGETWTGMGQPDLGGFWRGSCVEFALTQKADLKPSLKARVCPARTQWGSWFINHFYFPYANWRTLKEIV